MAALDTNVLVRWLVRDDVTQLGLVRRLIGQCAEAGESLFVSNAVVLELEWVLRSMYAVPKPEVVRALDALLSTIELVFEDEPAIEEALASYQASACDFADCLHLATALRAGHQPFWTFDKRAARLPGAQRLTQAALGQREA